MIKGESVKATFILFREAPPISKIMQTKVAVETLQKQLQREMQTLLQTKRICLCKSCSKLEALSPLKVMMRGYGLVYDEEKQVLKV